MVEVGGLHPPPSSLLRQGENKDQCLLTGAASLEQSFRGWHNSHNNSGNSENNFCYYTQCFITSYMCVAVAVVSRHQEDLQAGTERAKVSHSRSKSIGKAGEVGSLRATCSRGRWDTWPLLHMLLPPYNPSLWIPSQKRNWKSEFPFLRHPFILILLTGRITVIWKWNLFFLLLLCLMLLEQFSSDFMQESYLPRAFPLNWAQPLLLISRLLILCCILQETLRGLCPSHTYEWGSRLDTSLGSQPSLFQRRRQKSPIQPVA